MAEYKVTYARGRVGEWRASVRGLRRCRSRGRTLRQARVRLRKEMAAQVDEPFAIDLVEDVRLPGAARRLLGRHWAARRRVEREQQRAQAATRQALQALRDLSLDLRDASDLLGIPPLRLLKLWQRAE